jgi:RNA polymerase sigma-70 factor (ECF subfamily)
MAEQLIGIHCEAAAQLPPRCRRVYLMRKVHGMSHKEIAEELNIAISTVEKHMSKGVRDCASFIQQRTGDNQPNNAQPANNSVDKKVEQQHG